MSEHWGMRAFSCKIPNGKYLAKLYFAETYEGITGPGQRVFSFNVQGHEFKDFDIWVKAGGLRRAYIETVPVEVTNGEFRIVFTAQVENPAINAIEIVPQAEDATGEASSAATIRINAGRSTPFTDSSGQVWQPDSGFEGGMTNQCPGRRSARRIRSASRWFWRRTRWFRSRWRRFRSGLRLGDRHRLRRAAAVRAAHREDARRGRGVRRQVPLAI